jgi:fluoroquinolone resistance protein
LSSAISSHTQYAERTFKDLRAEHVDLDGSEFHECVFFRSSFVETVFQRCRFVECAFRECDLSLIQVPGSRFTTTRFEDCKVVGVNWAEAEWPEARLANPIGFFRSAISHSTFIGLSLRGIQIVDCVAMDVDFREADLGQADFGGTDLSQSLFGNTDLAEADLSRARNYRIDPAHNSLWQARFSLPEAMSLLHSMDIVLVEDT